MVKALVFIIDCPHCNAKVAAAELGRGHHSYYHEEADEPFGTLIQVGQCPQCDELLVGKRKQHTFKGYMGDEEDAFFDALRVYPDPPHTFSSNRIPKIVLESWADAQKTVQAGARIATCAMLGRVLEGVCRDVLKDPNEREAKPISLGNGIRQMKDKKIIDDRLFEWGQKLQITRNLAAHATDINVTGADVDDLNAFVRAIVEYVYDLKDRYDEYLEREAKRASGIKDKASWATATKRS